MSKASLQSPQSSNKKVLVLGAGLIGKTIAADLNIDYEVTTADLNKAALAELKKQHKVKTKQLDFTDHKALKATVKDFDLVIGAVPGHLGYKTVQSVIKAGKDIVDISFFEEDPFHLNKLAQEKEVTAIVDCGVAPGLNNIIAGHHHQHMEIDNFECYVGGLPEDRSGPFEYKAPFSPIDVIEEYTRPARLIVEGKETVQPALSEVEELKFKKVGTLEAFNTDGLRTLLRTIGVANMKEKTLRYPGHAEKMQLLRDAGFFSKDTVNMDGNKIRPLDMTTALLFPLWHSEPNEPEFTVMRIIIEGEEEDGSRKKYTYELYDAYDPETGFSSMARTTGYTCTAAARLVLEGDYTQEGISPPEYLGARDYCFDFVLEELKKRGVMIRKKEEVK